jgi:hypothetical protein
MASLMGINFPSRPPTGQKFPDPALPDLPVWQWNGTAWVQIGGGGGSGGAPVDSPTFTGDPKAPTPTADDNDTSIATTAFVTGAVTAAIIPPATVAPIMDSVAAVGTAAKYAREDHVHPTDTSRAALTQVVRYDAAQSLTAPQQLQARQNVASLGVIRIQKFTASGTYTPSAGLLYAIVECWGGGGAGGGTSTGTASSSVVGGGGGGGAYSRSVVSAASIGASKAVAIGAAGTIAFGAAGGAGGTTTFGATIVTAPGGPGGLVGTFSQQGAAGGTPGTGDFSTPGAASGAAFGDTTAGQTVSVGSIGASSAVGAGGGGGNASGGAAHGVAASISGFASGGGGGCSNRSAIGTQGGAGSAGLCIITEYCTQ